MVTTRRTCERRYMQQSQQAADTILVAGIDDHPVLLRGLSALSLVRPEIAVAAVAASVDKLLDRASAVDVVLLDLGLNDGSRPRDNVRKLVRAGAAVLIYVEHGRAACLAEAVAAGASGAVAKSSSIDELAESIAAVVAGGTVFSPEVQEALAWDATARPELSGREVEVLRLLGLGLADKQIARILEIAEDTVKEYLRRIRTKYAERGRPAVSRVELYRRSLEDGVCKPPS